MKKNKTTDTLQIEKLKEELEKKQQLYLRALADYQNLETRMNEQKNKELEKELFHFFRSLIEIKTDMDNASAFNTDEGLLLIKKKLENIFQKNQLSEINPLNQEYNPDKMECVHIEKGTKQNQVVKVLAKGYFYKDKLLEPAKVVVSQLQVTPQEQELN